MAVHCKGRFYMKFTHENESHTIRKRKGFVFPLEEPLSRLLSPLSIERLRSVMIAAFLENRDS